MQLIHFSLQTGPQTIPDEFPALFDGSMDRMEDIEIKLHIDPSVPQVAQTRRRISCLVRKDVEKELDRLENMDVIEKVERPTS
ncbi:MAG: hypothetical protein M3H12_00390 [Chromatiales bacterium]